MVFNTKMKNLAILSLLLAWTISLTHSSPVSREDGLNQLLLNREDISAAKQIMDLMKAHQQSMYIPSSPYYQSLPSHGRSRVEARVTKWEPEDEIRSSAMDSAHAQWMQDRLSRILQKVLLHTQGLGLGNGENFYDRKRILPPASSNKDVTVQGYIKTLVNDQTTEKEKGEEIFTDMFTCLLTEFPKYAEKLKTEIDYNGQDTRGALDVIRKLFPSSENFGDYIKIFRNVVNYFRPNHIEELVGREQGLENLINWNVFRRLANSTFSNWANWLPKDNDLGNILNVLKAIFRRNLNAEEIASFGDSINYLLNKYFLPRIDSLQGSQETKEAMKEAMKNAVKTFLPFYVKHLRGEKQNPEDQSKILRSLMTILATFNAVVTNDTTLLSSVNQLLSTNPTDEELKTKSQCLAVAAMKSFLEDYVKRLNEQIAEEDPAKIRLIKCGVDGILQGVRHMLSSIPTNIGDVGDCDGFPGMAVGTQEEKNKKMARFSIFTWG